MTINANIYVLFILLLMSIVGVVAWRLARRKSKHPVLITVLCMLLCLAPPSPCWRCSFWRSGGSSPQRLAPGNNSPSSRNCRSNKPLAGLCRFCGE